MAEKIERKTSHNKKHDLKGLIKVCTVYYAIASSLKYDT
jgi:hypothetical protein